MTQRETRVLEALLTTSSRVEAAAAAGVNRETVAKLLARPDFREEYDRRREDMLQSACAALQSAMLTAVRVLSGIMKDEEANPSSRISAARTVLEYGVKLTEQVDILSRLEAVEQAIQEGNSP